MTRLLTRKEVAELFRVSVQTINHWCKNGILPYETYPCGKRFDPDKIEAFRRSRSFGDSHSQHP
jgi:DNA-binding transcriptional MerR regulator